MIEIKPYDRFELKGRGIVFLFNVKDNEHLVGVKLIGEQFKIENDTYLIKKLEEFSNEHAKVGEQISYGILTDKMV